MTTGGRRLEVAWFAPSCGGDTARLGVADPTRPPTFEHNRHILTTADALGFDNVLIPSSFVPGIDPWTLAAAVGPSLHRSGLLPAVRVGEFDPPMFARAAASLQQAMGGRLTINIISSERAGESLDGPARYRRTAEAMHLLRQFWTAGRVQHEGEWWTYDLSTAPSRTAQPPPMYFGGASVEARDVAARHADCYLMWVETVDAIAELVADVRRRAAEAGRTLRFGLRTHVIVRETESLARQAAADLVSELDPEVGRRLKQAAHDHTSVGVRRQDALRAAADGDGFAQPHLWTGIGVARSGVGAAVVGDPDQVAATLQRYASVGVDCFILSGYPLDDEARRVAEWVLPRLR
ncbi:MAG: LLM class flavin-dependent oxidoreductase [Ilumatobacteraceae bacterium]